jgi:hypothetical protein
MSGALPSLSHAFMACTGQILPYALPLLFFSVAQQAIGPRPHRFEFSRLVFLNRRAAARYRALTSNIPGRERFSWKLSF